MYKKTFFYLLLFFNANGITNNNIHPIGCFPARFFASFFAVLNHLRWCERNNKTPIIYWGKDCFYYTSVGYNGSFNAWEYYFEPVSSLKYNSNYNFNGSYPAPDGTYIKFENYNGIESINERVWCTQLIKKYIKIKSNIINKIDEFYNKFMKNKKTIGIHLRGTDKYLDVKPVDPIIILNEANKHKDCQFLIATDEERLLNLAKRTLNGNVINYDAFRSNDNSPIHYANIASAPFSGKINNALYGEEVLIEANLLARCNILLHTHSNVSIAAHYFNPKIDAILFHPINGIRFIPGEK